MVKWLLLPYNFIHQRLNLGPALKKILSVMYRRLLVLRNSGTLQFCWLRFLFFFRWSWKRATETETAKTFNRLKTRGKQEKAIHFYLIVPSVQPEWRHAGQRTHDHGRKMRRRGWTGNHEVNMIVTFVLTLKINLSILFKRQA